MPIHVIVLEGLDMDPAIFVGYGKAAARRALLDRLEPVWEFTPATRQRIRDVLHDREEPDYEAAITAIRTDPLRLRIYEYDAIVHEHG